MKLEFLPWRCWDCAWAICHVSVVKCFGRSKILFLFSPLWNGIWLSVVTKANLWLIYGFTYVEWTSSVQSWSLSDPGEWWRAQWNGPHLHRTSHFFAVRIRWLTVLVLKSALDTFAKCLWHYQPFCSFCWCHFCLSFFSELYLVICILDVGVNLGNCTSFFKDFILFFTS